MKNVLQRFLGRELVATSMIEITRTHSKLTNANDYGFLFAEDQKINEFMPFKNIEEIAKLERTKDGKHDPLIGWNEWQEKRKARSDSFAQSFTPISSHTN